MTEELKTETGLPISGEPALEFPVIGGREELLLKIEQIFAGPDGGSIDIKRGALKSFSPENFIRAVKAAIEVAIADGLIPESIELGGYLDSLTAPGTRNSQNRYPGRHEREKRMEGMVNRVAQTLRADHGVKLVNVLDHSAQELRSLLEELHGPAIGALVLAQDTGEGSLERPLPDVDEVPAAEAGIKLGDNDKLAAFRYIMILTLILGSLSLMQVACSGNSGGSAPGRQSGETMLPTPTFEESIELIAQREGKLYYLMPGEGLDAVIWKVINAHDAVAYPLYTGTEDGRMTYEQALRLLEVMNEGYNTIIDKSNGTKNFSNTLELATVRVPSWVPDPVHYGISESAIQEGSYVIQPGDTLASIADSLGVVDRNAWYRTIKINGNPVDDINAIPAGGVITWPASGPASYSP